MKQVVRKILGILLVVLLLVGCAKSQKQFEESDHSRQYSVGDSVTAKMFKTTLVSVEETRQGFVTSVEDGTTIILLKFKVENTGTDDKMVLAGANFQGLADGVAVSADANAAMAKGAETELTGTVAAGKSLEGFVAYVVPQDYQELVVEYRPLQGVGEPYQFIYKK